MLELRLDNVVYPDGLRDLAGRRPASSSTTATSRSTAGRPTSRRTSSRPATGSRSASRTATREPFKVAKETLRSHQAAGVAERRRRQAVRHVLDLPRRDQMPLDLNEQLVVEYYSR